MFRTLRHSLASRLLAMKSHSKQSHRRQYNTSSLFYKIRSVAFCLSVCALASGCSSLTSEVPVSVEVAVPSDQRLNNACVSQVMERESATRSSQSPAQFLSLANQAQRCLEGISFYSSHPDNEIGMRLNALAVVNFLKSGDAASAKQSLEDFRYRFAQQDLVYSDFTSFIDTATALLEPNLSDRQLAMLNINPTLRSEISRTRNWSLN